MAISYVFCEGTNGSLDRRLLENCIFPSLDSYPETPKVVPAGSKRMGGFIEGYFLMERARDKTALPQYVILRDRDFDYEVPQQSAIIRDARTLATHRAMIENYLLHPQTLVDYIQSKGTVTARSKVPNLSTAEAIFRESCENLRFYTAARWAHGVSKRENSIAFGLRSNWPYISGAFPESIGDTDCRVIMSDIISNIKNKARQLDFDVFENKYAAFLTKFDSSFLLDINQCLIWFSGKDIAAMIFKLLGESNFFLNGGSGDYYDFALAPSRLQVDAFPDLVELRDILNGTTPL